MTCIRCLCLNCWTPFLNEQVSVGLYIINRVEAEANLKKGIPGDELWANVSGARASDTTWSQAVSVHAEDTSDYCDFTVMCMSMYSVTCSELFIVFSNFIWDVAYLPHTLSAKSDLTGAAVLKWVCLLGHPKSKNNLWSDKQANTLHYLALHSRNWGCWAVQHGDISLPRMKHRPLGLLFFPDFHF